MKYATLYSKDNHNNIRVWWMEIEDNRYYTVSGIEGGNLVTSDWTEVYGKNSGKKNNTSGESQAIKEVEAKYTKQIKKGYSCDKNEVDEIKFIKPMLAHKYKDYKHKIDFSSGHWIVQSKYNGHRSIAIKQGIFTRTGEKYESVPHIEESLKPFFDRYPDAVLDGEFFNNDLRERLNDLSSIIRKTKDISEEDLRKSKDLVKYYVYDGFGFTDILNEKCSYLHRKKFIDGICLLYPFLEVVQDYSITTIKELDNLFTKFLDDKQEGLILRDITKGYERKRSKNLLKYKPVDSDEGVIVDIKDGEGNWANKAKIITVNWKGKVFDITFKGNMEDAIQMLYDSDKWIGKEVTFEYYGLTGLGTPNYGQLDYRNCLKK